MTKAEGKLDQLKGSAKEAAGKVVNDKKKEAEGKADKAAGKTKDAIDKASDKTKDFLNK